MDLLELLKTKGSTFSVANVKKGDIKDRLISLSSLEKKEKISWDLRYNKALETFELGKAFFEAHPVLAENNWGLTETGVDETKQLFLIIANKFDGNELNNIQPKYLDTVKTNAEKKGLKFKAMSLQYYCEAYGFISDNQLEVLFQLVATEQANIYELVVVGSLPILATTVEVKNPISTTMSSGSNILDQIVLTDKVSIFSDVLDEQEPIIEEEIEELATSFNDIDIDELFSFERENN